MKQLTDEPLITYYFVEQQIKRIKPHPIAINQIIEILSNYYQLQAKEQIKNIQKSILQCQSFFQNTKFEGYNDINTIIFNILEELQKIDDTGIKKGQYRRSIAKKSLKKSFKILSLKLKIVFDKISKQWLNQQNQQNQLRWSSLLIRNISNQLNQDAISVAKKHLKLFICRICEQQIQANLMIQHCCKCEQDAESKKKLLELNLELANICDSAYQEKRNVQVKQAIKKMKDKQRKKQYLNTKYIFRRVQTLDDDEEEEDEKGEYQQELNNIANIMTQIINFAEKTLNTAAEAEDTKQTLVLMNDLVNSTEYIESQDALIIINACHKSLLDRLEYHKKQESLKNIQIKAQPNLTQDNIMQIKRAFTKSNSISFRMPKFQFSASPSQRIATDPIQEEEDSPSSPQVKSSQKIITQRRTFKMNSSIFKVSDGSDSQKSIKQSQQLAIISTAKTSNFCNYEANQSINLSESIQEQQKIVVDEVQQNNNNVITSKIKRLSQFKAQVSPLIMEQQEKQVYPKIEIHDNPSIKEGENSSNLSSLESAKSNSAQNNDINPLILKKKQKKKQNYHSQEIEQMQNSGKATHRKSRFFENQVCKSPVIQPDFGVLDEIVLDKGYHSDSNLIKTSPQQQQSEQSKVGIKDFEFLKPLGKGAYGWVFLVKKKGSGDLYALKIIDCAQRNLEAFLEQLKAERNIFEILNSNFVVKAYFSFVHEQYLCFVQEYMVGGDLASILKTYTALDEFYVRHYMAEIVLALEYLRQQNIVHRDLKPENILLDCQGHTKLADFGLSEQGVNSRLKLKDSLNSLNTIELPNCVEQMNDKAGYQTVYKQLKKVESILVDKPGSKTKKIVGTPDYIAPEIIQGISITNYSCDYWSLGIIMYELLCGIAPFNDDTVEKIFDNILNMRIEWPEIGDGEECISQSAYDLIVRLLEPDYTQRIGHKSIDEIKNHKFFKGIQWNTLLSKPGLIIPELNCESKDTEKMQQFLKKLEKTNKDSENKKLTQQLKAQLQTLERIDLLKQRSTQEAEKFMQSIDEEQSKIQRQIELLTQFYAKLYQTYFKMQ